MNIVKTIFHLKPKNGIKTKKANSFNNEFYIARDELSKQKLISFYGIEDCAITSGHCSCVKLENIFGASTISRGSNSTLAYSNTTLNNYQLKSEDSISNIKKNNAKNLKKENKKSKKENKKKKNKKQYDKETVEIEIPNESGILKRKSSIIKNQNEAVDNTINELKQKLMEKNSKKNLNSNDTINDISKPKLQNDLSSSETIFHKSNNNMADYYSSNPDVVIDINTLKRESNLSNYISRSNSHINNINIHNLEKDEPTKKEVTIDININAPVTTVTNDDTGHKNDNINIYNNNNNNNYNGLIRNSVSTSHIIYKEENTRVNDKCKSEESICNSSNITSNSNIKNSKSYERLSSLDSKCYKNRLSISSSTSHIYEKSNLFENQSQNKAFLNKLVARYSPQQRLFVSFNHLYDPLFVSNNFSKRYDMELKYVDLSVKDIYEHGLPYLLRSKRPLIEFCKELIKENQIEILFFINEVCNFQKKLFLKQSDILIDGKEIYNKYLSEHAICPLDVNQSLKIQCVKDLKSLKKECFHAISLSLHKNLDFIYEEFKAFVLKEHYENKTEFDCMLVTEKTDAEKKKFEDELIKLVEIYYKSNDEELKKKQEFIIENIKKLCNNLLN